MGIHLLGRRYIFYFAQFFVELNKLCRDHGKVKVFLGVFSSGFSEAVDGVGWPEVEAHRGKIVRLMDNEGVVRDAYLAGNDVLAGRLLFASVAPDHPAAAFMKRNDPQQAHDEIRRLVDAGFLVRTRIDAGLEEPRRGDLGRFERALSSGAQLLSTDIPEPDARFPGYRITLPAPPGEDDPARGR